MRPVCVRRVGGLQPERWPSTGLSQLPSGRFLCVIVWRFRSCVEWCVQATDVSERSRNESAYLGWLMPCVSHATGCGAGRVYHRPETVK